jgi:hypothetical protein
MKSFIELERSVAKSLPVRINGGIFLFEQSISPAKGQEGKHARQEKREPVFS